MTIKNQVKTLGPVPFRMDGGNRKYYITAEIRYDDRCGNGHNTFSITGAVHERANYREVMAGCIHNEIAKAFPKVAHLIKWHLMSSDGPIHYVANTVYHASTKDHYGLEAGQVTQIRNRAGLPVWKGVVIAGDGTEHEVRALDWKRSHKMPKQDGGITWRPVTRTGEGKESDLAAARSCAIWPLATAEQLSDEGALMARLPALIAEFKYDIEAFGLNFS